ncbi:MAG: aminotransferase class I/II-fold pyridoxal phosphate-dependent enzyme [Phycisphaerae bacterium]|nr:aminotransferase class I/II-fold pyridoxal phosphate-dependent enzyme [Phycisphaerae bacterium]
MHLMSIPRHQIETTPAEYAGIIASLAGPADCPGAFSRFEQAFAEYIGCRHAIAVSSGRLALHLILERLALEEGVEAIVPAFNYFVVVERFCRLGIVPRFCDIRRDDLNIDATAAERLITPRTRVLLVTHMFGYPADMDALVDLAERHNLILLEDCAHALGTRYGERFVGTFGKASIFSFSVLKLVTTFGGGMIATDDDELAAGIRADLACLRCLRPKPTGLKRAITGAIMDLGTRKLVFSLGAWPLLRLMRAVKPDIQQKMMTDTPHRVSDFDPRKVPRMHAFQAVLGRSQLTRAEQFIERRRRVGAWLDEELAGIAGVQPLRCAGGDRRHNGLYYGILADRSAELSTFLFRRGIDSETSEYLNCADLGIYRDYSQDCPAAREVQSRIVRLPNYPSLTRREARRIGDAIRAFYAAGR